MEEPGENTAFADEHIEEFVACYRQIVLTGVAYGNSKRYMILMHQIHGVKSFFIVTAAAAAVVALLKALNAHGEEKVAHSKQIVAEFLIYESSVGESVEGDVLMLFAQPDYVVLADERLAAGEEIGVDTELLAFGDDFIHHFV